MINRLCSAAIVVAAVAATAADVRSDGVAATAKSSSDPLTVAASVSETVIVPRYAALRKAAQEQHDAWKAYCLSPTAEGVAKLQDAYRTVANRWSGIEFVRLGPVSDGTRYERIAFWPDGRNAVARGVADVLDRASKATMTLKDFSDASAAAQGLTALERLLFSGEAPEAADKPSAPLAANVCSVGLLITESVAMIASEIVDDWTREPGGLLASLKSGAASSTYYQRAEEPLSRIATDIVAHLHAIGENKIKLVIGKKAEDAKPKSAEGWRSRRSSQAIAMNLDGLKALSDVLLAGDDKRIRNVDRNFGLAKKALAALPSEIPAAAEDRSKLLPVYELLSGIGRVRDSVRLELTEYLGVTIGFNALDGD